MDEIDGFLLCAAVGLLAWLYMDLAKRQAVLEADVADAHELARKAIGRIDIMNGKGITDE